VEPLELPAPPWIVGHRGAAGEAPENTLEGVRLALDQGADMVEVDLHLTADRRLVALHDADLRRLADHPAEVERLALAEIQGILAERKGVHTPALEEILEAVPQGMPLNLELKRRLAAADDLIQSLASTTGHRGQLLVSSFDWPLLAAVRRALPHLPLAPLTSRDPTALIDTARELEAFSVHCHHRVIDSTAIRRASEQDLPTLVFTVNRPAEARSLLAIGASGLFTDTPGALRTALEKSPP
jgi:glycerophosphoryl diester phosphodiesterase